MGKSAIRNSVNNAMRQRNFSEYLKDKEVMETPKQYAEFKLKENNGYKGVTRIFIRDMLYNSLLQSDKDFYSSALKELDLL